MDPEPGYLLVSSLEEELALIGRIEVKYPTSLRVFYKHDAWLQFIAPFYASSGQLLQSGHLMYLSLLKHKHKPLEDFTDFEDHSKTLRSALALDTNFEGQITIEANRWPGWEEREREVVVMQRSLVGSEALRKHAVKTKYKTRQGGAVTFSERANENLADKAEFLNLAVKSDVREQAMRLMTMTAPRRVTTEGGTVSVEGVPNGQRRASVKLFAGLRPPAAPPVRTRRDVSQVSSDCTIHRRDNIIWRVPSLVNEVLRCFRNAILNAELSNLKELTKLQPLQFLVLLEAAIRMDGYSPTGSQSFSKATVSFLSSKVICLSSAGTEIQFPAQLFAKGYSSGLRLFDLAGLEKAALQAFATVMEELSSISERRLVIMPNVQATISIDWLTGLDNKARNLAMAHGGGPCDLGCGMMPAAFGNELLRDLNDFEIKTVFDAAALRWRALVQLHNSLKANGKGSKVGVIRELHSQTKKSCGIRLPILIDGSSTAALRLMAVTAHMEGIADDLSRASPIDIVAALSLMPVSDFDRVREKFLKVVQLEAVCCASRGNKEGFLPIMQFPNNCAGPDPLKIRVGDSGLHNLLKTMKSIAVDLFVKAEKGKGMKQKILAEGNGKGGLFGAFNMPHLVSVFANLSGQCFNSLSFEWSQLAEVVNGILSQYSSPDCSNVPATTYLFLVCLLNTFVLERACRRPGKTLEEWMELEAQGSREPPVEPESTKIGTPAVSKKEAKKAAEKAEKDHKDLTYRETQYKHGMYHGAIGYYLEKEGSRTPPVGRSENDTERQLAPDQQDIRDRGTHRDPLLDLKGMVRRVQLWEQATAAFKLGKKRKGRTASAPNVAAPFSYKSAIFLDDLCDHERFQKPFEKLLEFVAENNHGDINLSRGGKRAYQSPHPSIVRRFECKEWSGWVIAEKGQVIKEELNQNLDFANVFTFDQTIGDDMMRTRATAKQEARSAKEAEKKAKKARKAEKRAKV
jgi:hypothetical protein